MTQIPSKEWPFLSLRMPLPSFLSFFHYPTYYPSEDLNVPWPYFLFLTQFPSQKTSLKYVYFPKPCFSPFIHSPSYISSSFTCVPPGFLNSTPIPCCLFFLNCPRYCMFCLLKLQTPQPSIHLPRQVPMYTSPLGKAYCFSISSPPVLSSLFQSQDLACAPIGGSMFPTFPSDFFQPITFPSLWLGLLGMFLTCVLYSKLCGDLPFFHQLQAVTFSCIFITFLCFLQELVAKSSFPSQFLMEVSDMMTSCGPNLAIMGDSLIVILVGEVICFLRIRLYIRWRKKMGLRSWRAKLIKWALSAKIIYSSSKSSLHHIPTSQHTWPFLPHPFDQQITRLPQISIFIFCHVGYALHVSHYHQIQFTMKLILSLALLLVILNAEVIPFDNSAIDKIFQQKKSAVFLFLGDETAEASSLDAFKAFDETNPEVLLALSTKNDGHGLFDRLAEYLGVNTQNTPQVLFLNGNAEKFRFDAGEISAENLANFVTQVSNGELEPFLKSAPIPEPNDEPVKVVVGKNFKEVVLNSEQEVLVEFYAPWCGHCKHLAPHYDEAARRIANNPNILLVKVDSTENEVSGVDIQGFPTLKYWGKDKSAEPLEYNGGRDADGIVQWLKEHTQYEWVEPAEADEVEPVAEEQL